MRPADELAAGVVRSWTKIYTAGLSPLDRDARREEIDSDLWEHARAGERASAAPTSIAGQILARCLLGVAADVSWRTQVAFAMGREKGEEGMKERVKNDGWLLAPLVLVGLGVFMIVVHIVGDGFESMWSQTPTGWNPSDLERAGAVLMQGILFVVLPIWAIVVRRDHPVWTLLMLAPWVLVCLMLVWTLWLPLLGIVTLIGAVVNLAQHAAHQDLEVRTVSGG